VELLPHLPEDGVLPALDGGNRHIQKFANLANVKPEKKRILSILKSFRDRPAHRCAKRLPELLLRLRNTRPDGLQPDFRVFLPGRLLAIARSYNLHSVKDTLRDVIPDMFQRSNSRFGSQRMPVIIDWTTSLDSSSERPEVLARFRPQSEVLAICDGPHRLYLGCGLWIPRRGLV